MIQFFIENQEVVLPDDFSFTQIDENPLITSNGEFTLDITISLRNWRNAKAAKFINRINVIDVGVSYNAFTIDDSKHKQGKIIISENTDVTLTFQFIAGNSEFNYNITSDTRKVWELDWGAAAPIDYTAALRSCNFPGYGAKTQTTNTGGINLTFNWMQEYVCAPVKIGSEIANKFLLSDIFFNNSTSPVTVTYSSIFGVENIVMQPYLMYYITKLPSLMGFSLNTNCLSDDVRANNMYLINSVRSLNYADALPDMTIGEFVSEIEKFFNVIFEVDKTNKSINIVSKKHFVDNLPRKTLRNVQDEFIIEYDYEESANNLGWEKLSYDLAPSGLLKYQFLKQEIIDSLQIVEFNNESELLNHTYDLADLNKFKIYRDKQLNRDYIYCREPNEMIFQKRTLSSGENLYYVNKFSSYGTGAIELMLKLVPAEMIKEDITVKMQVAGGSSGGSAPGPATILFNCQMPKSTFSEIVDIETQNLIDVIEDDLHSLQRADKLFVSFAMKPIKLLAIDTDYEPYTTIRYPMSYIDFVPEYGYSKKLPFNAIEDSFRWHRWLLWLQNEFSFNTKTTMRLNGTNGVVNDYHSDSKLDLSKLYTFTFLDTNDVVVSNIFAVNNQDYMPIRFERIKSRIKGLVKGTFYRMT